MNLLNRKPGKGPGSGSAAVIFRHGKKSLPAGRGRGAPWFFCVVAAWASLTLCAPAPARTISGTVTGNQYGSEISSGDVTGDLDLSGAHVIGDLIGGLTHDGKAVSSSVRSSGDAGDNINGSVTGGQGTNGAESNVSLICTGVKSWVAGLVREPMSKAESLNPEKLWATA